MTSVDVLQSLTAAGRSFQTKLPSFALECGKIRVSNAIFPLTYKAAQSQQPQAMLSSSFAPAIGSQDTESARDCRQRDGRLARLEMVDGEELVHVQRDVSELVLRDGVFVKGVLFITNFRLVFQPEDSSRVCLLVLFVSNLV